MLVFVEYKVLPQRRNEFLSLLSSLEQQLQTMQATEVKFYEGADQPGLFVEEFHVPDHETYEHIKMLRKEGPIDIFAELAQCIEGGVEKLHIWAFSNINPADFVR